MLRTFIIVKSLVVAEEFEHMLGNLMMHLTAEMVTLFLFLRVSARNLLFLNSYNSFEPAATSFTPAKLQKGVYFKCSNFMSHYCPFASQLRDRGLCYY